MYIDRIDLGTDESGYTEWGNFYIAFENEEEAKLAMCKLQQIIEE